MKGAQNIEATPIDRAAHRLIVEGFLPAPYQIDPHDQRPLWDFVGLAELLDQRPDELVQLLVESGPAHLPKQGIPSSWRALIEC